MPKYFKLADHSADVSISPPEILAKAYRDYCRYHLTIRRADQPPVGQERDVLIAGKVVVVLPIDIMRDEIVLIRQFRLAAHLANGRGNLVEFVAGRVEPDESVVDAARRECKEEIGVAPEKLVELMTCLTTPGLTDEEVTIFLAAVDASKAYEGPHVSPDGEQLYVHRVLIDDAIAALDHRTMHGSPVIIGLQWLALNRGRIADMLSAPR
jgi:ADP-ribose pyrophosphatase